jgi:hypothetical protein
MTTISLEEANKRNYTYPNIQTILFDLDKWSKDKAIKWLNKHEYIHKYHRLTKNQRRFMQHNPVENAEYYSKRLPNGIVLVFQYFPSEGAGIFDYFKKGIERIAPLRKEGILPPNARALLEKIKDETINSIVVVRTPIHSMISKALNVISLGKFNELVKRLGYDKLFHLSLHINGKYIFHKIEVPTLEQANPVKSNSEVMPVQITRTLNIGKFIDTTRQYMGDAKFSNYNAATNNCQVFITSALQANGLLTNELSKFINQNAEDIFKQLPQYVGKITDVITDIGARANRLIQGEGTGNNLIRLVKRKMKTLKIPFEEVALSNKPDKKIMVKMLIDNKLYTIHFGAKNSTTFLEGASKEKRDNYRKRHAAILLKDGSRAIDKPYSPAMLSYFILW